MLQCRFVKTSDTHLDHEKHNPTWAGGNTMASRIFLVETNSWYNLCPERLISVRMVSWNMSGVINIAVLPPGACPETPNPTVCFILTWQRMYGALTRSWWIMPHSWVSITGGDIGGHPAWSLSGPWWFELSAHNSYPHFSSFFHWIWWLFSTHPKIIKHPNNLKYANYSLGEIILQVGREYQTA